MAARRKMRGDRGSGSIYQNARGVWVAQVSLGVDADGKRQRVSVSGSSREDVAAKLEIVRRSAALPPVDGALVNPLKMSVSELLRGWLASVEPSVRPKTRQGYLESVERTERYLGAVVASQLDHVRLAGFYHQMQADGYASSTIEKSRFVLNAAFKQAVSMRRLLFNPVQAVPAPPVKKKQAPALSVDMQAQFEAEAWRRVLSFKSTSALLLLLVVHTGLRLGEASALRWSDVVVDDGNYYLSVERSVSWVNDAPVVGPPKTEAGVRLIPLTPEAIRILNHRGAGDPEALVFSTRDGGYLRRKVVQKSRTSILQAIGAETTTHGLRRTFSTRLWEAGVKDKLRAQIMGHASVIMTDDVYVTADHRMAAASLRGAKIGDRQTIGKQPVGPDALANENSET